MLFLASESLLQLFLLPRMFFLKPFYPTNSFPPFRIHLKCYCLQEAMWVPLPGTNPSPFPSTHCCPLTALAPSQHTCLSPPSLGCELLQGQPPLGLAHSEHLKRWQNDKEQANSHFLPHGGCAAFQGPTNVLGL